MLHCWIIWKMASRPPTLLHSGASFWRPIWRFGDPFWRFPTWGSRPTRAPHRGGWLRLPSCGLSPKHKELVFCLVLLNSMTSRLCFWCYILLLTQRFFWYYFGHQVMANFCCVAQKAASVAQLLLLVLIFVTNLFDNCICGAEAVFCYTTEKVPWHSLYKHSLYVTKLIRNKIYTNHIST